MDGDTHIAAPAQVEKALDMIDMVMAEKNSTQAVGGKTLMQVGQAAINKDFLTSALHENGAGLAAKSRVLLGCLAHLAGAAVDRYPTGRPGS